LPPRPSSFALLLFRVLPGLALLLISGQARAYDVLCHNGNTAFEAYFHTGVQVNVGPPTEGGLAAERVCRATLSWEDEELVVAKNAVEVDLDLFGVDFGSGHPAAAFQVKDSDAECCMRYEIYSLEEPPRLLRTLRGGSHFSGRDSYLDGRVEIWTDDGATVEGFEGFRASQLDFPPTCVLRFDEERLLDVSSEFRNYFDEEISKLRSAMDAKQLQAFQASDGKLDARTVLPPLLAVKKQVLELVWAYLYSDRQAQAWQALAELWPATDLARIRAAILKARERGMRAQVDSVSDGLPPLEVEHSKIYDSTTKAARPILVRYYPSAEAAGLRGKLKVKLVVDAAGKVWSVKVSGKDKLAYESVKRSTTNWKFIPALVDDSPVASRVRMTISLEQ
jgi:TonB-like protein